MSAAHVAFSGSRHGSRWRREVWCAVEGANGHEETEVVCFVRRCYILLQWKFGETSRGRCPAHRFEIVAQERVLRHCFYRGAISEGMRHRRKTDLRKARVLTEGWGEENKSKRGTDSERPETRTD